MTVATAPATIEQKWKEFCLACFGDISEAQYIDLRRTFYAGASTLYFILMSSLAPGDEPTEDDLSKMRDLHNEIFAFNEAVKAGKA